MRIEIIPVSRRMNLKGFDCGVPDLNNYLSRYAVPNDKKNISKAFAAVNDENPETPLGYYTVSLAQILFNSLPADMQKGIPKYPVPAMRIGKLATDLSVRKKGLGKLLLKDALSRAVNISSEVALYCVLVDALNEKAQSFYLKYGFIPIREKPLTLFLPLKTIMMAQ